MSEFDLVDLVRQTLDEHPSPYPPDVAREVAKRIPDEHLRDALEQAMPAVVRTIVSRDRGHATDSPVGHVVHDDQSPVAGRVPNRSWKVTGIRETIGRRLRERVAVGEHGWRFLGDCTADDLTYAANLRERHASAVLARAKEYRDLAEAVRAAGVATVRELPDLAERLAG